VSDNNKDGLPIPPHVSGEFYAWLWWASEERGAAFDLPDPVGRVDVWVDDRLAFRLPNDNKVSAVMTGENPAETLESRAALAGGKVLQELRIGIRRDDREFSVTLKGPAMHLAQAKLPQVVTEGGEEAMFDRMHLYEELCLIVAGLFREYAAVRASLEWEKGVVPALRRWVVGEG
jgi:hypothetical protein